MAPAGVLMAIEVTILLACMYWVSWWFISPDPKGNHKFTDNVGDVSQSRFFRTDGREGSILIFQALPVVVIAILSFAVIELRSRLNQTNSSKDGKLGIIQRWSLMKQKACRLLRRPVVIGSPLGPVLTFGDLLFIGGVLFVVFYHFGRICYFLFQQIDEGTITQHHHHGHTQTPPKPWQKVNNAAYYFGRVAIFPFALLWIPVSRGSPLLRLIGIPFEHAVKYHIWLAILMMVFVSLHSIGYIVFYIATNQKSLIYGWVTEKEQCAVVAGLVCWFIGLIMWGSSLSYVRRKFYEVFLWVHHLYPLYFIFWVYHAVWNYHFFVVPALLFLVDRFLRMVQSRREVDVISAKLLESGAVELKMNTKNYNDIHESRVSYKTLATWCIQIPNLAKLQWHFFSSTSTMKDNLDQMTVIVKPLGKWTNNLSKQLSSSQDGQTTRTSQTISSSPMRSSCPFSFKARVEGPYEDESNFYLWYKTLILISGGIGITPFLALLRDILHRYKMRDSETCELPNYIMLYCCLRHPKELSILNEVNPNTILPGYESLGLKIKVHVYITSQNKHEYEKILHLDSATNNSTTGDILDLSQVLAFTKPATIFYSSKMSNPRGLSIINNTSNITWVGMTAIASMFGYFILSGLANIFIIKSYDHGFPNYNRAHIVIACMLLGVIFFGGGVVFVWNHMLQAKSKKHTSLVQPQSNDKQDQTFIDNEVGSNPYQTWNGDVHLFHRPSWKDLFSNIVKEHQNETLGVLVSGSQSMQEDVARECKRYSSITGSTDGPSFDYHSLSFEL